MFDEDGTEEDMLEAEYRRKRDLSDPQIPDAPQSTYDGAIETNRYSSRGSYTLELVGQRRLVRRQRRNIQLVDMMENNLLGSTNQS